MQVKLSPEETYMAALSNGSLKVWTSDGSYGEKMEGVFDFQWWSGHEIMVS